MGSMSPGSSSTSPSTLDALTTIAKAYTDTQIGGLSATFARNVDRAFFPASSYASVQAAIDAANAAGGGVVVLPAGATAVSATIQMKSKVILSGPDMEWTVWGYDPTPETYQTAWLVADGSSGAVVEFGTSVVAAGIRNLLIKANNRIGINMPDTTTRGGNRIRNVNVNKGGVYLGQREVRVTDLIVMMAPGDGLTIAQQDSDIDRLLVGFCGGSGVVLTANSGPVRMTTVDSFDNTIDGMRIDGDAHKIGRVQVNNNNQRGLAFLSATSTVIHDLTSQNNGREFLTTGTTRYPDVEFAHPTGGNLGCGIIGGKIANDGTGSYGVKPSESVPSIPILMGLSFGGTYQTGNSPFAYVQSPTSFRTVGCLNVPDGTIPQGAVAVRFRANGSADMWQAFDGSNALAGVTNIGDLYAKSVKATGLTGAANAGRFVGVTTSGAPTTGTFVVGDYVVTQAGNMFVCVGAGTPGNWVAPRDTAELLASGEETILRDLINRSDVSLTSGRMYLTYWTARKSETVANVRTITGVTAAAATPTLCRIGVYTVDAAGAGALVASTANDTTLFAAANTAYTKALSASYAKVAGQRYATAVLVVSGAAMPTFLSSQVDVSPGLRAENAISPRRNGFLGSQSDLPSTFTDASLTAFSSPMYSVLIP